MTGEKILDQVNRIIFQPDPKRKQIAKITKLWKYVFRWTRKSAFNYFCDTYPELRAEIPDRFQMHYNLTCLYACLTKHQLSTIIKRLEKIEQRNKQKNLLFK